MSKRAGLIFPASTFKSYVKATTPSLSISDINAVAATALVQVVAEQMLDKLSAIARTERVEPGGEHNISEPGIRKFQLDPRRSGPYRRFFRGVISVNPRCVRPGDDELIKQKIAAATAAAGKRKNKKKDKKKAESA